MEKYKIHRCTTAFIRYINVRSHLQLSKVSTHPCHRNILVGLFMTTHGRIQMDFFDVKKMDLKPRIREIFISNRRPTEAGFLFENGLMNDTLSVEFEQARPQGIRLEGQSEGQKGIPEGQTIEKCQIQTDCNNCFLMIKSRDQIFNLQREK